MTIPKPNMILKLYTDCVHKWHENASFEELLIKNYDGVYQIIYTLHLLNYHLWHQEDIARKTDVDDSVIADVKRKIDKLNQTRHDTIERIDDYLCQILNSQNLNNPSLPMNSETPGSIIDRMSILSLKIYHMEEQTKRKDVDIEHIQRCQAKVNILKEQEADLKNCLKILLDEIFSGRKKLKVYRQFKMYNDPMLNPQIYEGNKKLSY
jgi:cell division protein FtsB